MHIGIAELVTGFIYTSIMLLHLYVCMYVYICFCTFMFVYVYTHWAKWPH